MQVKKHIWLILVVFILVAISAFLVWQYDLLISTLQTILISTLVAILSIASVVIFFFKDKLNRINERTMPAVQKMLETYKEYYHEELNLRGSLVQRRPYVMNRKGDINDFVAIFTDVKDEEKAGKKIVYYNLTIGDIWEVVDRPAASKGRSTNLFRDWEPSKDPFFRVDRPRKRDYIPLGIEKTKSDFDTSIDVEDEKEE